MKLEFSGQRFENYSKVKYHEIIFEPNFSCGLTDGQTLYRQTWWS